MKKRTIITLDTETCPIIPSNTVDPKNMLVYDIGWTVSTVTGEVIVSRAFIVAEIFFGEQGKMQSAYYADKIPEYIKQIARGERIVLPFASIRKILMRDIANYDVNIIQAFNTYFDLMSLNNTLKYLTEGKEYYYFNNDVVFWDIMKMITPITKTKKYKNWCIENEFLTSKGYPKRSAEVVYRYIVKDNSFVEKHCSIEDVTIELEIYKAMRRKKVKIRRELFNKDI